MDWTSSVLKLLALIGQCSPILEGEVRMAEIAMEFLDEKTTFNLSSGARVEILRTELKDKVGVEYTIWAKSAETGSASQSVKVERQDRVLVIKIRDHCKTFTERQKILQQLKSNELSSRQGEELVDELARLNLKLGLEPYSQD